MSFVLAWAGMPDHTGCSTLLIGVTRVVSFDAEHPRGKLLAVFAVCRIAERRRMGRALMLKLKFIFAGTGLLISGFLAPAQATQSELESCRKHEVEKTALVKTGIQMDMEKGAEWGKANLSPERLRQVRRFIHLEEQLTFRCPELIAAAAVRQIEEQARLKALAAQERARLWKERMEKIVLPARNPQIKVARAKRIADGGIPPLPERKSR